MDDGARPVVTDVTDRLSRELVGAEDLDSLARTLIAGLTEPGSLECVRAAALGLVEGAGRRLRYLSSERWLGREGQRPDWTHIDAYDDTPLNRVVRVRQPVMGHIETLRERYPEYCRDRLDDATVSLAVLPLEPVVATVDVIEAVGPPDRPLGALALAYSCRQPFDSQQRHELGLLARVVSYALRHLAAGATHHPLAPGDPRGDGAVEAATLLPNDERAPSEARRFLRQQLDAWEVSDDVAATAELCLSEVVTNAVIHAGSSSHLLVALIEGTLEVCVRDHGGPPHTHELVAPIKGEPGSLRVYGRGLMLVDSLTSDWGADTMRDGTSVWFTLALEDAV